MNATTEKTFNAAAAEKVKELAEKAKANPAQFTRFEKQFIDESRARVQKFGDETFFSEKQAALIDRMHKERIVDGKEPGDR